jgi:cbb3-type cytochrome c oxidase subunit III
VRERALGLPRKVLRALRRPRVVALACGVVLAVLSAGCGSVAASSEQGDASRGKELFVEKCASCHALADAGTRGTIGPDLDDAFEVVRRDQGFDESTIEDVVRGQIAYPVETTPSGAPGMPADLVTGDDAEAVAAYVASVAGLPVQGGGEEGITASDGAEIFLAAGCGSCHTLSEAGSSGTIGPNLDDSKPSVELAVERVTNGSGAMPAFRDQLSEEQIQTVAEYVSGSAR